jgi:hypothetical protein
MGEGAQEQELTDLGLALTKSLACSVSPEYFLYFL